MSTWKSTHKRKITRRPPRLKEARAGYVARSAKPRLAAQDKQLEFSICLPASADAEAFTDKLIELVEAFKGTVGGGAGSTIGVSEHLNLFTWQSPKYEF